MLSSKVAPFMAALAADMAVIGFGDVKNPELSVWLNVRYREPPSGWIVGTVALKVLNNFMF